MMLYHGSNIEIDIIDLGKCRPRKDFGQGFYLTDLPDQAMRMAERVARIYGGKPVVTTFEVDFDALMKSDLSVRVFGKPDESWASFVMYNRTLPLADRESTDCSRKKQYDLVIGPVADDDLALLFRQFQEGLISVDILTREMTYKKLTIQYCFLTQPAIDRLEKAGVIK
ncbi:MAG: DUF3990 domain-containing protein [Clostridia bacterium]|nr:DUF3990 domain-containing protein [Clostridia bacterium]